MKKSQHYHIAQAAVVTLDIGVEEKLEILATLMEQENFEKYLEKEKEAQNEAV